ncbi:hypothetical protein GPECTOR_14g240 [Gonium pectorale]|uniref:Plastid lipid-associated protein/fibrillin conserved domain-containing protein n=1 Tax=Gonium pectorale TaxID=33097 RepID=A0A150GMC5_GONPE|nr:hypothetical protein GPECTOR_14g240 [Gonium pectorale]|eukprot:KXZ50999.1 hypothetical protein GPECTOR_14g240 [Gonium pectorale]
MDLSDAKTRLLQLVSGTSFGARASAEQVQQIGALVDSLAEASGSAEAAGSGAGSKSDAEALDGSWRLLYTSEESVHGIVRSLPVARIGQRIDLRLGRVTNAIDFGWPPADSAREPARSASAGGFGLRAGAPLRVSGANRIQYRFDSFKLLLPWSLPAPSTDAAARQGDRSDAVAGAAAPGSAETAAGAGPGGVR